MLKQLFLFSSLFLSFTSFSQDKQSHWLNELIAVQIDAKEHVFIGSSEIHEAQWDTLQQPRFWQEIMLLSPDSVLVNSASTRTIVGKYAYKDWMSQSEIQKKKVKDSLRFAFGIDSTETLNVTTGKNDFYRFDLVFSSLPEGVLTFEEYGVDPWYAQSILLIESPGKIAKSSVGAYGPFQLMPGVARAYGLKVSKSLDERKDFKRSAYAASQLISKVCIPSAKAIAKSAGLEPDEQAIWFRLLTMHVYHAGSGNVKAVVNACGEVDCGEELIQKMWQTKAASFGNSSQNYSQLTLAAHLQLEELIHQKELVIYKCPTKID
ncbi:MAG: transglycosylase SLT domain-containing protein [Fluviicola sp.]|jgi:hypothetical protein